MSLCMKDLSEYNTNLVAVIVDATSACSVATFNIGSSTSSSRSWDIKVTQYGCNEGLGGKFHFQWRIFDKLIYAN